MQCRNFPLFNFRILNICNNLNFIIITHQITYNFNPNKTLSNQIWIIFQTCKWIYMIKILIINFQEVIKIHKILTWCDKTLTIKIIKISWIHNQATQSIWYLKINLISLIVFLIPVSPESLSMKKWEPIHKMHHLSRIIRNHSKYQILKFRK